MNFKKLWPRIKFVVNFLLEKISKLKPLGYLVAAIIALWQVSLANQGIRQIDKNIEISRNNIEISRSNSIDQRFKDAIELLGSDKIPSRLGAIYALDHLAKETFNKDKSYTKSVFEILCSYIREKTNEEEYIKKYCTLIYNNNPNKDIKPSIEIQTIINLLFRIDTTVSPYKLFRADLYNAKLLGANLDNAFLGSANLDNANLYRANLESANLNDANLKQANLQYANLYYANLENAFLGSVNLDDAYLHKTNLDNAYLGSAYTDLDSAYLSYLQDSAK